MTYKIQEQFLQGKTASKNICEDFIVVEDNVIAVIDGAADKSGRKFSGVASGRFAAQTIADVLPEIVHDSARLIDIVKAMSMFLKQAIEVELKDDINKITDFPSLSFVAYIPKYSSILRVGDCPFMIDNKVNEGGKLLDYITSMARAIYIEQGILSKEFSEEDLYKQDFGRNFIMPLLKKQYLLANNSDSSVGYGVVNGNNVPEKFIEVFSTQGSKHIVLSSDGYPDLKPTLEESEEVLQIILKSDPLFFRERASTKGLQDGQISYDDRAYISFNI